MLLVKKQLYCFLIAGTINSSSLAVYQHIISPVRLSSRQNAGNLYKYAACFDVHPYFLDENEFRVDHCTQTVHKTIL